MRLQVFFGDFAVCGFVKKRIKELQLLFSRPFRNNRNEVYEFAIVDRTIQLRTVLYHEENFISEVSILYLDHAEVL